MLSRRIGLTEPFSGRFCTRHCRSAVPSEGLRTLRTHVRFKDQIHRAADRHRRPPNRLRDPWRVRAGARWENSPGVRGDLKCLPPTHADDPSHCAVQPAARSRLSQSASRFDAVARTSRSKRWAASAGCRVAALRKPRDRGSARRLSMAAVRAKSRRGLLKEEPAATYSPRGLPPKYHRRRVA